MATEDIYGNKKKFERVRANLKDLLIPPDENSKYIYYCKNKDNLQYFEKLFLICDTNDISYIRRMALYNVLKLITYATDKDLSKCKRDDINKIVAFMHTRRKKRKGKVDFIKNLQQIWKNLFPELDEKGRVDDERLPYVVRHLKVKIDKSKEVLRNDRLTYKEFDSILKYFDNDVRIQAYLMLALESLARPQELLYTKISDYELHDNYARIFLSSHGKEGVGLLQCIDSFPYVQKWYKQHPLKSNKGAFFFINTGNLNRTKQLTPFNINKKLRQAIQDLKIDKNITCYSIKRNGVTFRRLRGDSDAEIQHAARWTSTKQLKTYDMSNQEDAFKIELIKRGLIKDTENRYAQHLPKTKECIFCNEQVGFTEEICPHCKHVIDRDKVKEDIQNSGELAKKVDELQAQVSRLTEVFTWVMKKEGENLLKTMATP